MSPRQNKHLRTTQPKLGAYDRQATKQPIALRLRHRLRVCCNIQRPHERVPAKCFSSYIKSATWTHL
jgi:hypothetical protein